MSGSALQPAGRTGKKKTHFLFSKLSVIIRSRGLRRLGKTHDLGRKTEAKRALYPESSTDKRSRLWHT